MCLLLTHPLVSIVISDYSGVTVSSPSEIPAEVAGRCIDPVLASAEVPARRRARVLMVGLGVHIALGVIPYSVTGRRGNPL